MLAQLLIDVSADPKVQHSWKKTTAKKSHYSITTKTLSDSFVLHC